MTMAMSNETNGKAQKNWRKKWQFVRIYDITLNCFVWKRYTSIIWLDQAQNAYFWQQTHKSILIFNNFFVFNNAFYGNSSIFYYHLHFVRLLFLFIVQAIKKQSIKKLVKKEKIPTSPNRTAAIKIHQRVFLLLNNLIESKWICRSVKINKRKQ